jgi:hypothetical protein
MRAGGCRVAALVLVGGSVLAAVVPGNVGEKIATPRCHLCGSPRHAAELSNARRSTELSALTHARTLLAEVKGRKAEEQKWCVDDARPRTSAPTT